MLRRIIRDADDLKGFAEIRNAVHRIDRGIVAERDFYDHLRRHLL